MLESNHYSVLFTGGLDSTYRLCQLARDEKAVVQPIYIVFPIRPELKREIEAQNKILEYICNHPNTKAKFLPIRRIQRDEIPKDQRILDLEEGLVKYNFGWQYLYIALLAKWEPGLELCHEILPDVLLNKKVIVKEINGRVCTDIDNTEPFFVMLFKNVTWPILGVSRQQMVKDLKEWGYDGIWNLIWWCYEAVDGKPCGFCNNCYAKMHDGDLFFLFDKPAIKRYYIYKYLKRYKKEYLDSYLLYVKHYNVNDMKIKLYIKKLESCSIKQIKDRLRKSFCEYKKRKVKPDWFYIK